MDELSRELRERLLNDGAALVGFARLEGLYLTEDGADGPRPPELPMGVAMALPLPRGVAAGLTSGPAADYERAYDELNARLDALAEGCAAFLAARGYRAVAQTEAATREFGVYTTRMPHKTVALHGGLGWIGKSTLLVTPAYGSAVRLASVLTDAPLTADEPLANRCGGCVKCRDACPAGAVTGHPWSAEHGRDWLLDPLRCRKKARELAAEALHRQVTLCGRCIGACPYTRRYAEGKA